MIPALRNKTTGMTHLAAPGGDPFCGTRIDGRLLPFQVAREDQVKCAKCRRAGKLALRGYLAEDYEREEVDAMIARIKPPRMLRTRRGAQRLAE